MINTYFGFSRLPFQPLSNHHNIYQTPQLALLQSRFTDFLFTKGIALLFGETGAGKTTIIHFLLTTTDHNRFKPVYLSNYPQAAKSFLRLLSNCVKITS